MKRDFTSLMGYDKKDEENSPRQQFAESVVTTYESLTAESQSPAYHTLQLLSELPFFNGDNFNSWLSNDCYRFDMAVAQTQTEMLPERKKGSKPWFDMHAEQLRIVMQKAHSAFDAYKKKRNKRSRLKLKRARAEWKRYHKSGARKSKPRRE